MGELSDDQQQRLIAVLEEMADSEQDEARAGQLRSFPFAVGSSKRTRVRTPSRRMIIDVAW
jgi:hypothetical protein